MDFPKFLSSFNEQVVAKAQQEAAAADNGWANVCKIQHAGTFLLSALKFLMESTYSIQLHVANMKFRQIRPILLRNGVQYERTSFKQKLEAGAIALEKTESWIKHAVQCNLPQQEVPASFQNCYVRGLVDLVAAYPNWGGRNIGVPETLELDHLRIRALNAHFHTDVMCTVMIVTLYQKLLQHHKDLLRKLADMIIRHPPFPTRSAACIEMVVQAIVGNKVPQQEADVIGFLLEEHLERSHHMYAYYVDMYKKHWVDVINMGFAKPNYAASSNHVKLPDFARSLVENTEKRAMELCTMAMLNKEVHCNIYDKMMVEALVQGYQQCNK